VDGWYYDAVELSRLKLTPVPVRGAGLWMREVIYEGDWNELATYDQWKVAGANEYNKAVQYEATVLPGSKAKVR
jgi:hypothetical protein